jgi:hypothetical protein
MLNFINNAMKKKDFTIKDDELVIIELDPGYCTMKTEKINDLPVIPSNLK